MKTTIFVAFGLFAWVSFAPAQTKTYYEVWRSETDNRADAYCIASWLEQPAWQDNTVQSGHTYWYWARAVTTERQRHDLSQVPFWGVKFSEGSYFEFRCPMRTKGNL